MNTRRAAADAPFRQERYMSSSELERGLLANCVASRLRVVDCSEERELIWWLQRVSHERGGIAQLVASIIASQPNRFATRTMQAIGIDEKRVYKSSEVEAIRDANRRHFNGEFLLRGEYETFCAWSDKAPTTREQIESECRPTQYPAAAFLDFCRRAAEKHLGDFLFKELCLNPAVKMSDGLWYCPDLKGTLQEAHRAWIAAHTSAAPVTSIGLQTHGALNLALKRRKLVVIDGVARIGKTFSVQQWIDRHPGRARYVQAPSSGDDGSFFRAIAISLGLSSSQIKAVELRERIESTLRDGDLMLVIDEAHNCFPSRNCSRKPVPHRINWILGQLVNMRVPVALVTTPQFTKAQQALVKMGGWSDEQLKGRILRYETLPDSLPPEELEAVARYYLPHGGAKAIKILVKYAETSEKYLQAIESLIENAEYIAEQSGRKVPSLEDLIQALEEGVIPSDKALADALKGVTARSRKERPATPMQDACTASARRSQDNFIPPTREVAPVQLSDPQRRGTSSSVLAT